jgi:ADP-ribose pyrophosphatase YjhB (NUDIX family)
MLKSTPSPSSHEWIEPQLFQHILELMPIPAVHAVITHARKHLLLKRKIAPLLGGWWIPGGRVNKYESLMDAIKREVREETGLECKTIRQVGTVTFLIDDIHTISTIFWITPIGTKVQLNYEHSTYQWVDKLPKNCHPKLREIFKMITSPVRKEL